ncbi:MAG TPA: hypothetical protein VEB19_08125 [Gemmatimonadaceae bacterium]|nr:hypothetical protein [Gemmatimonadaceae bacterium]
MSVRIAGKYRLCAQRAVGTSDEGDVLALLRCTLRDALPSRAAPDVVAYEVAILYYALVPWARVADAGGRAAVFTYHRRSGLQAVLVAALAISLVEVTVVHLLLYRLHPIAATVLLVLSIYGIVWLLGFMRSVRLRPVLLSEETLHVRMGLLWDVRISYSQIAEITTPRRAEVKAADYLRVAAIGDPQFIVELREPQLVTKPYGLGNRNVRRVGFAVDDRTRFEGDLRARVLADRSRTPTPPSPHPGAVRAVRPPA